MIRKKLAVLLAVFSILSASAGERSVEEMMRIAQERLASTETGISMRKLKQNVRMLDNRQSVAVMGYEDGGFVVMAVDDMYPAVLGYSETRYNPQTDNGNFKWWLDAMEQVVSVPRSQPKKTIAPDTDKYPAYVRPLMQTKWDQSSPYNDLCPDGCPTGCVATAAAQTLRFHEWPKEGKGNVFTYVPFGDFDGTRYEEDIDGAQYDYSLMAYSYGGMKSNSQKEAVAKLMYHIGLAMKAQYASAGTGTYAESLAHGLRTNLGYPYAVNVKADDYTEEEWMDMIFHCISDSLPIVYGGADSSYTGHEFVLHGYNKQGLVYINWGWGGEEDGYFDLSSLVLYWGIYDFNSFQDMVIRVNPRQISTEMAEVTVDTPGTLADLLSEEQRDTVVWLKVNGRINSSDIKTLRIMAGCNELGHGTWGSLSILDLSDAAIVAGGDPYLVIDDQQLGTSDDEMPYMAFYKCAFLIDVKLPGNLRHYSDAIFAGCNNLDRVEVQAGDNSDFLVIDNQVLNHDRTELIEQLPSEEVGLRVPDGVKVVHPYAFAGRYHYERLYIPESVQEIDAFAFNRCYDLSRTYIYAPEPPQIDPSAIDDLDLSLRYLYVPKGSVSKYKTAVGWRKYNSRIMEFDAETEGMDDYEFSNPAHGDVYAIDGRLVRYAREGTRGLEPGVYVIGKKKWVVR